jgi:hypothetical protein
MNLKEALDQIANSGEDDVIFARRPWSLDVDAQIGTLDPDGRVPGLIRNLGLDYFLEGSVAKEVLGVLSNRNTTADERRELLMYYAEHDAYPTWAYKA